MAVIENELSLTEQLAKVKEEITELEKEFSNIEISREKIVEEAIDVMQAAFTLLQKLDVKEADFDKHIRKLEKYKKEGRSQCAKSAKESV